MSFCVVVLLVRLPLVNKLTYLLLTYLSLHDIVTTLYDA